MCLDSLKISLFVTGKLSSISSNCVSLVGQFVIISTVHPSLTGIGARI